jgi:hypothetical protein
VERRLVSLADSDDLDWRWAGSAPVDATPLAAERVNRLLEAAKVNL